MSVLNNTAVTIDTVVPALNIGEVQISADRRSTKEKPLTDAERIRRAVLPAGHWGELATTHNGERSQSLTDLVREGLRSLANDRLRDELAAAPELRSIELSKFTVAALLAWNAETASNRGSITFTRDEAQNWFDESATAAAVVTKHGAVKAAPMLVYLRNRYGALAAKNHGLRDEADALKLLALIAPADATGTHAAFITELTSRLTHIAKALAARAADATISMDDI